MRNKCMGVESVNKAQFMCAYQKAREDKIMSMGNLNKELWVLLCETHNEPMLDFVYESVIGVSLSNIKKESGVANTIEIDKKFSLEVLDKLFKAKSMVYTELTGVFYDLQKIKEMIVEYCK